MTEKIATIRLDDRLVGQPEANTNLLQISQTLVAQLNDNDMEAANHSIQQLCRMHESSLFQDIGKLTRRLHENLNNFSHDEKLETLMHEGLPDAKKRLDYVVQITEESAHKTLAIVENCMPMVKQITEQAQGLHNSRCTEKESTGIKVDTDTFLLQTIKDGKLLSSYLTDVLMAQSYQDISGQIIQRVIKLVQDIETSLVAMIRTCHIEIDDNQLNHSVTKTTTTKNHKYSNNTLDDESGNDKLNIHGYGPVVPGVNHSGEKMEAAVKQDNESDNQILQNQDDVDDLLSTLGF